MSWSNSYIGIPWTREDHGRTGTHCWGLVRLVYAECLGLDVGDYGPACERARVAELMRDGFGRWPWRRPPAGGKRQSFDILVIERAGIDDHVGIVVTPDLMLHLPSGIGGESLITAVADPRWKRRIVGHFRHEAAP